MRSAGAAQPRACPPRRTASSRRPRRGRHARGAEQPGAGRAPSPRASRGEQDAGDELTWRHRALLLLLGRRPPPRAAARLRGPHPARPGPAGSSAGRSSGRRRRGRRSARVSSRRDQPVSVTDDEDAAGRSSPLRAARRPGAGSLRPRAAAVHPPRALSASASVGEIRAVQAAVGFDHDDVLDLRRDLGQIGDRLSCVHAYEHTAAK